MRNLDKFRGWLLGGAAGDALGYEVEFIKERAIKDRFGSEGISEYVLHDGKALFCYYILHLADLEQNIFANGSAKYENY